MAQRSGFGALVDSVMREQDDVADWYVGGRQALPRGHGLAWLISGWLVGGVRWLASRVRR